MAPCSLILCNNLHWCYVSKMYNKDYGGKKSEKRKEKNAELHELTNPRRESTSNR